VHTRRAHDPWAAFKAIRGALTSLADRHGLEAAPGRLVVDLRPPGVDKGRSLEALARARAARAVLFAGDDLGDLPAYDAVVRLRQDGIPGLTVCSASAEVSELRERADLTVDGPPGVVAFLAALAAAIGDG
jgi:trehalose 6-phosphate phosphatase